MITKCMAESMHGYAVILGAITVWCFLDPDPQYPSTAAVTFTIGIVIFDVCMYALKYFSMIRAEHMLLELNSSRKTCFYIAMQMGMYIIHRFFLWATALIIIKPSPVAHFFRPYTGILCFCVAQSALHGIKQLKHEWVTSKFEKVNLDEAFENDDFNDVFDKT